MLRRGRETGGGAQRFAQDKPFAPTLQVGYEFTQAMFYPLVVHDTEHFKNENKQLVDTRLGGWLHARVSRPRLLAHHTLLELLAEVPLLSANLAVNVCHSIILSSRHDHHSQCMPSLWGRIECPNRHIL